MAPIRLKSELGFLPVGLALRLNRILRIQNPFSITAAAKIRARQLAAFWLRLPFNREDFVIILLMTKPDLAVIAATPDVTRNGGAAIINDRIDGWLAPGAQKI
jgi:hypothetical protein